MFEYFVIPQLIQRGSAQYTRWAVLEYFDDELQSVTRFLNRDAAEDYVEELRNAGC